MRYEFLKETVLEKYGIPMFSITNADAKICGYAQKPFDIPEELTFHPSTETFIFEKAVMLGGVVRGGVVRGGVVKASMLQIQGTRHFVYASFTEDGTRIDLGIGCEFHDIDWWPKNFESLGKQQGYTQEQIEEYALYIKLFCARYYPEKLT
jgi:hypothetical protein